MTLKHLQSICCCWSKEIEYLNRVFVKHPQFISKILKFLLSFSYVEHLLLLLVLREKEAALSGTGSGLALDWGVHSRLTCNTDGVLLVILRRGNIIMNRQAN